MGFISRKVDASPSPFAVAFRLCCPRCGQGKLFGGALTLAERCSQCDLDLRKQDAGDGPAFFAIILLGFGIVGGAGYVEYAYQPPYWLHAALWIPAIAILTLPLLRFLKALLIAWQYQTSLLEPPDDESA